MLQRIEYSLGDAYDYITMVSGRQIASGKQHTTQLQSLQHLLILAVQVMQSAGHIVTSPAVSRFDIDIIHTVTLTNSLTQMGAWCCSQGQRTLATEPGLIMVQAAWDALEVAAR